MSHRTDPIRTNIAKDILAAMVNGACSTQTHPSFASVFVQGIYSAPAMAVTLADALIEELDRTTEGKRNQSSTGCPLPAHN